MIAAAAESIRVVFLVSHCFCRVLTLVSFLEQEECPQLHGSFLLHLMKKKNIVRTGTSEARLWEDCDTATVGVAV